MPYRQQFIRFQWDDGSPRAHPDLNKRLVADARERGTSRTEVILSILSRTYGVEHAASNRRPAGTSPGEDAANINLRIPEDLHQAVAYSALRRRRSVPDEIIATLSAHYGLPVYRAPVRSRRPRRAAA